VTELTPVRPNIRAMRLTEPQRVRPSSEFRAQIQQAMTEAQRRKEDLLTEVSRLETEIDSRHIDVAGEDDIIMRCEAALTIEGVMK
jgi:hypothetical protein